MATKNKVILVGRLGKDPEIRYTPSGKAVCKMAVATDHNYQKNGEWVNETDWHNVEIWGDAAERINTKARKGQLVYVEGEVRYDTWEDDQGQKHYATKISARDVSLLEKSANAGEYAGDNDAGEVEIPIRPF